MTKRLYRSRQHRVFAGVCGGFGEYFDVDPVFVRILAVILVFAHGIGLLAYLVALIAMPRAPLTSETEAQQTAAAEASVEVLPKPDPSPWRVYLPGLIFILLGVIFLMDHLFWWFHWHHVWPVLLIIAGGAMIWRSINHHRNNGGIHESFES
jgi:phage shock protein C